jgi:phosphoglycolate phosphatase
MTKQTDAVLFDLDGTLLDTAPDLAMALNVVLSDQGLAPLPFERIRPVVSHGGRALIELGFGISSDHPEFEHLKKQLLDHYQAHIADATVPFPGMENVLLAIEEQNIRWGVVTNKPAWLTDPLLEALGLVERASVIVSGDTLAKSKPHPDPLLYACREIGSNPAHTVYVGDARRDIEAARRAGMHSLVALFGYLMDDDRPDQWGANALIEQPSGILDWIEGR